ncbi:MAG: hypothetical protein JJT78_05240 [Leptospira sp.]|nr:hypothetical protein [Leptospira sp.]
MVVSKKILRFLPVALFLIFGNCFFLAREPGNPPKIEGVPIPDSQRTIYIQNFQNASYAPAFHTILTQYVKGEIDRRGRFIQTRDRYKAAYRVMGEVVHYQLVGNLMDLGDQHLSSEMFSVARIDLQNTATGERIRLERNEIPGRAYFSRQLGYRETESQAQDRMARVMAVKIAEELERAWYFSIAKNIED